jgi:tripeptide aminopeptidase
LNLPPGGFATIHWALLGPFDLSRNATTAEGSLPAGVPSIDAVVASPAVREAFRLFAQEKRWIDEQHLALCRIPAPTFQEGERAAWFLDQFRSFGLDAKLDRAGNVLATFPNAPKSGPLVAITAHLDTVLTPSLAADIRVEKGKFLGPGVSDNGAGLAALLATARALAQFPLADLGPGSLLFVANVGEEGEGNLSGMRFLCRPSTLLSRIRYFLVLDGPSTDHVTSEALACRRFEIQLTGPGGHSWSDHGTVNPVHALARAICEFLDARQSAPKVVRCSYNFGVIDGGSTVNAIPTSARAKVDLRAASSELLDQLTEELTQAVQQGVQMESAGAVAGRICTRIRDTGSRPGGRLPDMAPLLQYLRCVDHFLGIRSWPDCASTDANIPLSLGLQAVSIGAGGTGGGAHTPQEWYSPEDREQGLRRIVLAAALLLIDASHPARST